MPLTIGISTCPNDTFAFAGLLEKRVTGPALDFVLDDVEALNARLLRGELDAGKASFHAALHLAADYAVLPAGAALGFGVGPLLLAATPRLAARSPARCDRVLCPGRWTTATLLYQMFFPEAAVPEQTVFSRIMPELVRGGADYGVVIHEGRFTYEQHGLSLAADLGELWEKATDCPLPLGGIVVRRDLGPDRHADLTQAIRASLQWARAHRDEALVVMRRHAQELSDDVLWQHVDLYVNDATLDLGEAGWRALDVLAERALAGGVVPRLVSLRS
jgi:1,4-dihydroxy-6-naphthoate synthase